MGQLWLKRRGPLNIQRSLQHHVYDSPLELLLFQCHAPDPVVLVRQLRLSVNS